MNWKACFGLQQTVQWSRASNIFLNYHEKKTQIINIMNVKNV